MVSGHPDCHRIPLVLEQDWKVVMMNSPQHETRHHVSTLLQRRLAAWESIPQYSGHWPAPVLVFDFTISSDPYTFFKKQVFNTMVVLPSLHSTCSSLEVVRIFL